jgi:hypothetical protein
MAVEAPRQVAGTVPAMTSPRSTILAVAAALAAAALLALAAGCGGSSATGGASATGAASADGSSPKVVLIGDSIAVGEALPLSAALRASGVAFASLASDGGGNVVGPFSEKNWRTLPGRIAAADPDVVVYQLTTYDWGSRRQQQAGYEKLRRAVADAGAKLVFVTAPPIRPDDFYRPHMTDLRRAPDVARAVAAGSPQVTVLDAGAVWGATYRRTRDGLVDRSTDGIHACPQGAARFASWLVAELAQRSGGFTPAPAEAWANAGWAQDDRFRGCGR